MTNRAELMRAIETAYDVARANIDLIGCYYGRPHWDGPFVDAPFDYYYFLAGLVAQLRCSRIFEIGAHFGGSIFSMSRGVNYAGLARSAEIVTVDVKDQNAEAFARHPRVKRILGNCFKPEIARQVASSFSGPIDLFFVDALHYYEHTNRCLNQYVPLLSPRIVVLDDIRLNTSMERLWAHLSETYGERAIDVTDWSRREQHIGFGLLLE